MIKIRLKVNGTEIEYEGRQKRLNTNLPHLLELATSSHNGEIKKNLGELNESLQTNLANLDSLATSIAESSIDIENKIKDNQVELHRSLEEIVSLAHNPDELIVATRKLQEMQASFSMQYLALQQKIQQENREFNLVSNIMKTKHEAAKNAVNNIR